MTPLPKRRHSTRRSGKRQAGQRKIKMRTNVLSVCPKCHNLKRPHYACENCGFYR